MGKQSLHEDDLRFLRLTPLDRLEPEDLLPDAPALPAGAAERIRAGTRRKLRLARAGKTPRRWPRILALVASVLVLALLAPRVPGLRRQGVVYAMEQAVRQLSSYHGVIEEVWLDPDTGIPYTSQPKRTEIWWDGGRYRAMSGNDLWVSDGSYAWTVKNAEQSAMQTLAAVGDGVQQLDLRLMAAMALRHPNRIVGTESVAGRPATKLAISPEGGHTAYLWIDEATKLPVKFLQPMGPKTIVYTYTQLDVNPTISPDRFKYEPPGDYTVIRSPSRYVASIAEAADIAGFAPLIPAEPPRRVAASQDAVVLDYGESAIVQSRQSEPLGNRSPYPQGSVGEQHVVVAPDYVGWWQDGVVVAVYGPDDRKLELARQLAPQFTLPDPDRDLVSVSRVKLQPDLAEAREQQQRYDDQQGGSGSASSFSAAYRFVNPDVAPGILLVHDSAFRVVADNGKQAVVAVAEGPYARIYLQRFVRPDITGIWSVVGYDPR